MELLENKINDKLSETSKNTNDVLKKFLIEKVLDDQIQENQQLRKDILNNVDLDATLETALNKKHLTNFLTKMIEELDKWYRRAYDTWWKALTFGVQSALVLKWLDIGTEEQIDWMYWEKTIKAVKLAQVILWLKPDWLAGSITVWALLKDWIDTPFTAEQIAAAEQTLNGNKKIESNNTIDGGIVKISIPDTALIFFKAQFPNIDVSTIPDTDSIEHFTWIWYYKCKNWDVYIWNYKNGKKEWKWIYIFNEGDLYMWDYKNDKKEWKWIYSFNNGNKREWTLVDDLFQWPWEQTMSDGTRLEVLFKDDEIVFNKTELATETIVWIDKIQAKLPAIWAQDLAPLFKQPWQKEWLQRNYITDAWFTLTPDQTWLNISGQWSWMPWIKLDTSTYTKDWGIVIEKLISHVKDKLDIAMKDSLYRDIIAKNINWTRIPRDRLFTANDMKDPVVAAKIAKFKGFFQKGNENGPQIKVVNNWSIPAINFDGSDWYVNYYFNIDWGDDRLVDWNKTGCAIKLTNNIVSANGNFQKEVFYYQVRSMIIDTKFKKYATFTNLDPLTVNGKIY